MPRQKIPQRIRAQDQLFEVGFNHHL